MSEVLLNGSYAEVGPILVPWKEWEFLRRHLGLFCKGQNAIEIGFAITGRISKFKDHVLAERVIALPAEGRPHTVHIDQRLVGQAQKDGIVALGHAHTYDSAIATPADYDFFAWVEEFLGRPIFHIVITPDEEYEVYVRDRSNGHSFVQIT